jgi:hypothetical protein
MQLYQMGVQLKILMRSMLIINNSLDMPLIIISPLVLLDYDTGNTLIFLPHVPHYHTNVLVITQILSVTHTHPRILTYVALTETVLTQIVTQCTQRYFFIVLYCSTALY